MDKPEGSLQRDLLFTESTLDNLNMKKKKSKDIYRHLQREYVSFFLSLKWKNNKTLRGYYKDLFIKNFKPELNRRLYNPKNWGHFKKVT